MYQVVVHLNDAAEEKQQAVLRNVANLRADLGDDAAIELVIHGPGIVLVTHDHPLASTVRDVLDSGVGLAACRNSLRSKNLTETDLQDGVAVVTSGMGHLARRQHDGWAYLRP